MDQPAWSATTPSHLPSSSKADNVPQPMTLQPSCQSAVSNAYDPLPQSSTQIIPSPVLSTKVHEPVVSQAAPQTDHSVIHPSKIYELPPITNQHSEPPKVPSKRHEIIAPTLVPMHSFTRAPSKVHDPLQQTKQAVLHTDASDEPPLSHIASQPPEQAVYPARHPSKTYQNLPSMNQQQSMLPHVPSKRYETRLPAVAPKDAPPAVLSKVHDPLAQSQKAVLSCVPSAKAHDKPQPAQASSQPVPQEVWLARQPSKTLPKSATKDQQLLARPHAPSNRYESPVQPVVQTKSLKDANLSMEYYSQGHHQESFNMDECHQYY
ncbi:unnamed protein product [Urochloa humidicola]